jgi:ubiquinone/menaquinone biosynthesis C-methylase UbiE
MGLYARHIGPRLLRCACSDAVIADERRKLVPRAHGIVLEIGIGPGLNLPFYDPAKVLRVIGVDPDRDIVGLADLSVAPVPVEIIHAPAEALPLADRSVDTAVVTFTLCSVDDPVRAAREIRRMLKPDGLVLFLEHGLSDDPKVARWQRLLEPLWKPIALGCHLTRSVVPVLEAAGLRIEEAESSYLPRTPRPLGFKTSGTARPA